MKVLGTFITEWDEGRAICNTLLSTKKSAEMYAERLTELAVALGFDGWLGLGYHFSVDGCQISNDPWCNISCQTYQPFLDNSVGSSPDPIQFNVNLQDASFCGGGNITFKGSLGDNAYFTTRLFQGEVHLDEFPIHITYSVKSDGRSLLGLSLKFLSECDEQISILFAYDNMNHFTDKFDRVVIPHRVTKFAREAQGFSEWTVEDSNISMSGHTLTEISVVCYKTKPKAGAAPGIIRPSSILQIVGLFTRKMLFHFQNWGLSLGRKILKFLGPKAVALVAYAQSRLWPEVNMLEFKQHHKQKAAALAQVDLLEFFASLGHITIKTSEHYFDFPPSTLWKVKGDNVTWATRSSGSKTVSIKIVWSLREGDSSRFPRYTIYAVKQDKRSVGDEDGATAQVMDYIGVARVRAFYISEFVVPPGILSLKFIIPVCGVDGACQKLDTCPAYILDVEGQ